MEKGERTILIAVAACFALNALLYVLFSGGKAFVDADPFVRWMALFGCGALEGWSLVLTLRAIRRAEEEIAKARAFISSALGPGPGS